MKSKNGRRTRLMLRERDVAEYLRRLEGYEKTMVMSSAWRVAVMKALEVMPEAKIDVLGRVRVNNERLGAWLLSEVEKQFKAVTAPPTVDTGEIEFEG